MVALVALGALMNPALCTPYILLAGAACLVIGVMAGLWLADYPGRKGGPRG